MPNEFDIANQLFFVRWPGSVATDLLVRSEVSEVQSRETLINGTRVNTFPEYYCSLADEG